MNDERKNTESPAISIRSGIKAGKGLGDQMADFTRFTGIDRLAAIYTDCTGKDCGCEARRDWLNEAFPG